MSNTAASKVQFRLGNFSKNNNMHSVQFELFIPIRVRARMGGNAAKMHKVHLVVLKQLSQTKLHLGRGIDAAFMAGMPMDVVKSARKFGRFSALGTGQAGATQ
jgi:hypothetical protein